MNKCLMCNQWGCPFKISIYPKLSWSPEKTLPLDLAGMVRMKQHERWAGMLLEKAGVQQLRHWEGLEIVERQPLCWRGVLVRERSKQHRLRWCLAFSATVLRKRTVRLLFRSFIALSLSVWEVYSHGLLHFGEIKVGIMSWDQSLAWRLQW